MKKIVGILFALMFTVISKTDAQDVKINIETTSYNGRVEIFDPAVNFNPQKFISVTPLDKKGNAIYTARLTEPRYIELYFNLPNFVSFQYNLFLSPGDQLLFKADFKNNIPMVSVSGKGSENNQPQIFALTNIDLIRFKNDDSPDRVIATLNAQKALNEIILKNYIKRYRPSPAFVKYAQLNNQYLTLCTFYNFYHNMYTPYVKTPGQYKWQKIEDSLMAKNHLNNDHALISYNYDQFIQNFVIQEPPVLIQKEIKEPTVFYKKWYGTTVGKGKEIYDREGRNLFIEKVINRYFKGATLELAYAHMFRFFLRFKHNEGLDIVFLHFKKRYPRSKYIALFEGSIANIIARQKLRLTNKMIFVPDNGTQLNTLSDVISLFKGKTVLVDMWGTWCSPCRVELEKFAPKIRAHFSGKNIVFLYIDNKDMEHEDQWKKVISYYKIEGVHILANNSLDKDIMTRIKSTGYPTHFMIKKDGSFFTMKTQDEADTTRFIKEIENELRSK